jgi:hypothetical protein
MHWYLAIDDVPRVWVVVWLLALVPDESVHSMKVFRMQT